ncbi:MAG TPA: DUF5989 family protein [Opitutaceae bacterium]|nr:DUF5989 family protein [Opitutaceae bacterium]
MPTEQDPTSFRRQAAAGKPRGSLAEFLSFVLHNKKWWLTPIIIVLLLVGLLVFLGGTGVAPLIYTLF